MFMTGKSPYPIERTLLVTGALDALMDSKYKSGARIETPHLVIKYPAPTLTPIRPRQPRPSGASTEASSAFLAH